VTAPGRAGRAGRRPAAGGRSRHRQAVAWAVLAVVVATALVIGTTGSRAPTQPAQRARALAEEIACPQCAGESVAQSSAPAAVNIYREIERQIEDGRSDDEIRGFLAQQFGEDVLLRPSATGPGALVWALPVVVAIVAAAALAVTFRRWRQDEALTPTDEDRVLVAAYLEGEEPAGR